MSIKVVRKLIEVVRKWRQMKKHFGKTSGHDPKTKDQKRIKQTCFHHRSSSTLDGGIALGILVHLYFKPEELLTNGEGHRGFSESFSAVAGSGKRRKKRKTQFIVFCQPHKTLSGSKKKKKTRGLA